MRLCTLFTAVHTFESRIKIQKELFLACEWAYSPINAKIFSILCEMFTKYTYFSARDCAIIKIPRRKTLRKLHFP